MEIKQKSFFLTLLLAACLAAPPSLEAAAAKDRPVKVPKFPRKGVWLNAEPLSSRKAFRDKITLVYFWDYTSVNSLRELNLLKRWHLRYQPYGFQMIFVHAPEFDFATEKNNVIKAIRRLEITYPVFLDNHFKLWEDYAVKSWPTKFLVNSDSHIVHSQVGEGGYLKTEEKIREEILALDPSVVLPASILENEEEKYNAERCGVMSPETYMGHKRAGWWGGEIANAKGVLPDQTVLFRDRGKRVERGFFAEGLWTNKEDHFEHARETMELEDYVGLLYLAHEVYAVINYAEGSEGVSRVYVTRDGIAVPPEHRGQDLREDAQGMTYLLVQEPRLYYLIAKEEPSPHEIRLWTQDKGLAVNSLAFSNQCLSDFDHL